MPSRTTSSLTAPLTTLPPIAPAVVALAVVALGLGTLSPGSLRAQDPPRHVQDPQHAQDLEKRLSEVEAKLDVALEELASRPGAGAAAQESPFRFGGYGESHANFTQGSDRDFLDNHRFVAYLGYRFADWIQLHSETEIEHSFVDGGGGELSLEQLYTEFAVCDTLDVRVGRYLVPVGIVNERHEPTTFHGVERPSVETVLIPTTWSQDGIGVAGQPCDAIAYQLYVGSGLDGSQFDALDGIREGRQEERPGISEPGFTGRLDLRPCPDQQLRAGLSFFAGGLDNADQGTSMAPGFLQLYSADFEYGTGDFTFRGVYVLELVQDAGELDAAFGKGVAERMQGYYVEGAYHFLPDGWKTGKLADADAAVFARWEDYDTQDRMPAGVAANPAGDRHEVEFGVSFFPTSKLVLKADFRIRDDGTAAGLDDQLNFGIGWSF